MLKDISFDKVYAGNTLRDYLTAFVILLGTYIICRLIGFIINKISAGVNENNIKHNTLKFLLQTDRSLYFMFKYIPVYVATKYLHLNPFIDKVIQKTGIIIITFSILKYFTDMIDAMIKDYYKKSGANRLVANSLKLIAKLCIWTVGILFAMGNLGVNITTLIAGLGVGGMALALASKEILSDLFNYFIITFDKPFSISDDIAINGSLGNVKAIGLRGTRITSVTGEQIVISNTDMTKSMLHNYSRMERRRINIKLGVKYDINSKILRQIPDILKEIVLSVKGAEFGSAVFFEYGDSALVFNVYYYINKSYSDYLYIVQEVNFRIYEEFEKRKISFAFPSYSVYLENQSADSEVNLQGSGV